MRIAKFIAASGICSRREAEKLIFAGKVKVDNSVITSPALNVTDNNKVEVDNKIVINNLKERLWLYYKPIGLITSHKDTQNRPTVFDNLSNLPRVISIGRLDINSEGLLLLTNSGELANRMMLPSNKFERVYHVRAYGNSKIHDMSNQNIKIRGINYFVNSLKLLKSGRTNNWYEVVITEGKNREIRRIFEYLGFKVNKLIRMKYGKYDLGNLRPGEYREINI